LRDPVERGLLLVPPEGALRGPLISISLLGRYTGYFVLSWNRIDLQRRSFRPLFPVPCSVGFTRTYPLLESALCEQRCTPCSAAQPCTPPPWLVTFVQSRMCFGGKSSGSFFHVSWRPGPMSNPKGLEGDPEAAVVTCPYDT